MQTNHIMEDTARRIKKEAFLTAFSECGIITLAAEAAGIARSTHYRWLEEDPDYPALFMAAAEQAGERLEQEARRRAVEGVEETVYYQGKPCGTVTKYSDTLLIFMLKGAKPEKYQERIRNEITCSSGAFVVGEQVNTLKQLKEITEKEQRQLPQPLE